MSPLNLTSVGMFEFGRPRIGHVAPIGEVADLDPLINLGVNGASAGAYGTIADLWRFDQALLNGELLPAAQREAMWTASLTNGFLHAFQWTYPAPLKGCAGPVKIVERQGLVGGIELRNVSFRYGTGDSDVLQSVNLKIEPGEIIALIGPSGGGKTTLLKIMMGLIEPSGGQVLIDGQPLTATNKRAWRRACGSIAQDDLLFAGSLGENILTSSPCRCAPLR